MFMTSIQAVLIALLTPCGRGLHHATIARQPHTVPASLYHLEKHPVPRRGAVVGLLFIPGLTLVSFGCARPEKGQKLNIQQNNQGLDPKPVTKPLVKTAF